MSPGLTGDLRMADVVRAAGAGAIIMHMQGTPATMQIAPRYDDVVTDPAPLFCRPATNTDRAGHPA